MVANALAECVNLRETMNLKQVWYPSDVVLSV